MGLRAKKAHLALNLRIGGPAQFSYKINMTKPRERHSLATPLRVREVKITHPSQIVKVVAKKKAK